MFKYIYYIILVNETSTTCGKQAGTEDLHSCYLKSLYFQ